MDTEAMTDEHRWLMQLAGSWTCESEASMGPDQPRAVFKGTDKVRALGDFWIVAEGEHEAPGGGTAQMIMTLGYDPKRGRFRGTFIHSMMSYLWQYDGELDAERKRLTLDSTGPSMSGDGRDVHYRDVIAIVDGEQRTFTSYAQRDNGEWVEFMSSRYRRA